MTSLIIRPTLNGLSSRCIIFYPQYVNKIKSIKVLCNCSTEGVLKHTCATVCYNVLQIAASLVDTHSLYVLFYTRKHLASKPEGMWRCLLSQPKFLQYWFYYS